MPLPAAQPRTSIHTRHIVYHCYLRSDGLWDIEGYLSDVKDLPFLMHAKGRVPGGTPIHDMAIRMTLDDSLTIRDLVTSMDATPFAYCLNAEDPMRALIGVTMGKGWRALVEERIGGAKGCTHLRDLVINLATAAFQSITAHLRDEGQAPAGHDAHSGTPPHFLGKCMSWAFDSPVTMEYEPAFFLWQPKPRSDDSR
jgi:hypothetical protein